MSRLEVFRLDWPVLIGRANGRRAARAPCISE